MSDCKVAFTPFLSSVMREAKCSTPLVDVTLYRQLVGSLIYLTHTCPDISFAVGMVSRFMQERHELHWKVDKHILHYIQGTHTYGIFYVANTALQLVGYTDLDYARDLDSHESTLGYMFYLGSDTICWKIKKQNTISLSSTDAKYQGDVTVAT